MEQKITTMTDAERIIRDMTERYLEEPTDAEVHHAGRRLVGWIGGYGRMLTQELADSFDLDAALKGQYTGDVRNRIRQAWADDDREMINYWVLEAVRQRGDLDLGDLDAVLAAHDQMYPGYLDATQV